MIVHDNLFIVFLMVDSWYPVQEYVHSGCCFYAGKTVVAVRRVEYDWMRPPELSFRWFSGTGRQLAGIRNTRRKSYKTSVAIFASAWLNGCDPTAAVSSLLFAEEQ